MTALDDLANRISKDIPSTEAELRGPGQKLRLQQEQMTALHEVSPNPFQLLQPSTCGGHFLSSFCRQGGLCRRP